MSAAAVLAGLFMLAACGREGRVVPGPNLVLVTFDTTRMDHCSAYGYRRETTPSLAELARGGARFDLAYAPTSTTGPTHASIFTARHPIGHGVMKNGLVLDERHETLAERLAAHGYQTAGFVSSFVLDRRFGYAQGFEHYDDHFERERSSLQPDYWEGHRVARGFDRSGDETTQYALDWLVKRDGARPFFLFVHYFDPHSPYRPPPAFSGRFRGPDTVGDLLERVADYDAEIAFADQQLGRLLDALAKDPRAEGTIVIVTADHGEGLMDHEHMTHGVQIYEESVRVPLVVSWPDRIAGAQRFAEPVELVDLYPTLLELAGLTGDPRSPHHGVSLARALLEAAPLDPERPVFLQRRHYVEGEVDGLRVAGEKFAIRVGDWKLIDGPDEGTLELYDLARDPHERHNRLKTERARADALSSRLRTWRETQGAGAAPEARPTPEDARRLETLGYVE